MDWVACGYTWLSVTDANPLVHFEDVDLFCYAFKALEKIVIYGSTLFLSYSYALLLCVWLLCSSVCVCVWLPTWGHIVDDVLIRNGLSSQHVFKWAIMMSFVTAAWQIQLKDLIYAPENATLVGSSSIHTLQAVSVL